MVKRLDITSFTTTGGKIDSSKIRIDVPGPHISLRLVLSATGLKFTAERREHPVLIRTDINTMFDQGEEVASIALGFLNLSVIMAQQRYTY